MKVRKGDKTSAQILGLIRPVIKLCLKLGIKSRDLDRISELAFILEASDELRRSSQTLSVSRISVMTGLRRPNIVKALELQEEAPSIAPINYITKILGAWQNQKRFVKENKPRPLSFEGISSEFADLVRSISTDLNHHTVLFELERLGLISREEKTVKLQKQVYDASEKWDDGLLMLAQDFNSLGSAVVENLSNPDGPPNLHARTSYDNIDPAYLEEIREWLLEFGKRVHKEARNYLSKFDRDLNPKSNMSAAASKVTFGTFGITEQIKTKPASRPRKRK